MQEKKCAYCRKPIEQGKEVKNVLIFIRGAQLAREELNYCSKRCASYDQMAHEA
ncbi:YdaE family protein [Leclercia adecarboxylata]|uniref:YdaE family protein n=1 Tax=Leclercia adecarboxylata TaxID=83655 RepID=UPI0029491957|nr:YdaE family protein [Leclercia adecarboxylata]MDV5239162.1 YdaE family protein [Leclercia adecarboxylata]MDV5275701.1 YdaE family protein [Leclercia adecarboxylata]MDV5461715.1 YdaE family protein [Leclercia adecarboxylata]MDV5503137.1 YdaE family protein [Leclercia adecarboxylata]MDV5533247.1 YdaE family protein [Leclercia adecarboxylata]